MNKVIRLSEYSPDMTKTDLKHLSEKIRFFAGPRSGESISFDRPTLVLGSCKSADLILKDSSASDIHCVLAHTEHGVQIIDLNSLEGTFVNGRKVQSCRLQAQDKVRVGRTQFEFQVFDMADTEIKAPTVAAQPAATSTTSGSVTNVERLTRPVPLVPVPAATENIVEQKSRTVSGRNLYIGSAVVGPLLLLSAFYFFLRPEPPAFSGRLGLSTDTSFIERLQLESLTLQTQIGLPSVPALWNTLSLPGSGGSVGASLNAGKGDEEVQLLIAKEHFAQGDYRAVVKVCDSILKEKPRHNEAKKLLTESLERLRELAQKDYVTGFSLMSLGKHDEARTYLKRVMAYVGPGDEYYQKADNLLKQIGGEE